LRVARTEMMAAATELTAVREQLQLLDAARAAAEQQAAELHATDTASARKLAEALAMSAALAAELDAARQGGAAVAAPTAAHGAAMERWQASAATAQVQADDLQREIAARDRAVQALEAELLQRESERHTRQP